MKNTKNLFKNAKVGDTVYQLISSGFVKGKIVSINEKDEYPIGIMFDYPPPDNSLRLYNYDGEPYFENYEVSLFWKSFDIPTRNMKKIKKNIKGYAIYDLKENSFESKVYSDKETAEQAYRVFYHRDRYPDRYIITETTIDYEIEQ